MRMVWDTIAAEDEAARQARRRYFFQPMMRPGEMRQCFLDQGLEQVERPSSQSAWTTPPSTTFWSPLAAGEGPLGKIVAALDSDKRGQGRRRRQGGLRRRRAGWSEELRVGGMGGQGHRASTLITSPSGRSPASRLGEAARTLQRRGAGDSLLFAAERRLCC
jgi:hypothetical protein